MERPTGLGAGSASAASRPPSLLRSYGETDFANVGLACLDEAALGLEGDKPDLTAAKSGGVDGTRTRGLRRDRPAF